MWDLPCRNAAKCCICVHRGAPDTHHTVSDKPPDWFCFDFLKEYKESGGLAQPSLDRHSIGRGGGPVALSTGTYIYVGRKNRVNVSFQLCSWISNAEAMEIKPEPCKMLP